MIVHATVACLALAAAVILAVAPARAASVKRVETSAAANAVTFKISGLLVGGETGKLQAEVAKIPPGEGIAVILDLPGGLVRKA